MVGVAVVTDERFLDGAVRVIDAERWDMVPDSSTYNTTRLGMLASYTSYTQRLFAMRMHLRDAIVGCLKEGSAMTSAVTIFCESETFHMLCTLIGSGVRTTTREQTRYRWVFNPLLGSFGALGKEPFTEKKTSLHLHTPAELKALSGAAGSAWDSNVPGSTLERTATKAGLMRHGIAGSEAVNVVRNLPTLVPGASRAIRKQLGVRLEFDEPSSRMSVQVSFAWVSAAEAHVAQLPPQTQTPHDPRQRKTGEQHPD